MLAADPLPARKGNVLCMNGTIKRKTGHFLLYIARVVGTNGRLKNGKTTDPDGEKPAFISALTHSTKRGIMPGKSYPRNRAE